MRTGAVKIRAAVSIFAVLLASVRAQTNERPGAVRFAGCFENELRGNVAAALSGYRDMLETTAPADQEQTERLLFRIGTCELRLGRPETARKTWRKLVENYPAQDGTVARTREILKVLERELDRVVVIGDMDAMAGAAGSLSGVVHIGEWGGDPVVLTDARGHFRAERRVVGTDRDDIRYGLVFAEHPVLPRVAVAVLRDAGGKGGGLLRKPEWTAKLAWGEALSLFGKVTDPAGRPVRGALVHVTGFKDGVPLPFDRLLPPVFSTTNGEFTVEGVAFGVAYVVTASKPGHRLIASARRDTPATAGSGGAMACGTIVLQQMGEVALRGKVVDDAGTPLRAEVSAWSLPPVERELARVNTDRDGHFILRDLRENAVAVKAEAEGLPARMLTGLKPMGQDMDIVLRGKAGSDHAVAGRDSSVPPASSLLAGEFEETALPSRWMVSALPAPLASFPLPLLTLRWIRGLHDGRGELKGHVVVYHFGSPYVEEAVRSRYPDKQGNLSQLVKLYADADLVCVWVLREGEEKGEPAQLAEALYPELAMGTLPIPSGKSLAESASRAEDHVLPVGEWGGEGNVVVGRDGMIVSICSDTQLFKAVKKALGTR